MAEKRKIIDEKGKFFGKINVVDLIILAVVAMALVVIGLKLAGRSGSLPGAGAGTTLKYTVLVPRVQQEVYDAIVKQVAEGPEKNVLMANGEMLQGSYVESATALPAKKAIEAADGRFVVSEEPGYVDATFVITAVVSNPTTQAVGTQEIRVGKTHIVKTQVFELMNGTILTVEAEK